MKQPMNLLLAVVLVQGAAWAQGPGVNAPAEPVDSGAIIMPPKDAGPAASGDNAGEKPRPKVEAPAPRKAPPPTPATNGKESRDSACKGPVELCKQASPK